MTAPTEAQTTVASNKSDNVASSLPKNRAKLKYFAGHTHETDSACQRVGLPQRSWQAGFQSHV
jgi:hypothetical protein